MVDQEYRQRLLEYTRNLRQRREDQASKQGFSIWGLYVAMVYLVWAIVPQASTVMSELASKTILAAIFTHTHLALIAFSTYLMGFTSTKPKSSFDYRVAGEDASLNYGNLLLITFVFAFLPAYTSYLSLSSGLDLGDFQRIQLWINLLLSSTFTVSLLIGIPFQYYYEKKNRLPLVNLLPSTNSDKVTTWCTYLVISLLLIGNAFVLLDYVSENPESLLMTFNVSLLLIVITILARLQTYKESLYDLHNLERDIILHNIDNLEIVNRLERNFLGHQIGEWLDSLVRNVNEKSNKITEFVDGIDDFIEEINKIDPEYKAERQTRLNSYIKDLKSRVQDFEKEITPLADWFEQAHKREHKLDPVVVNILEQYRKMLAENSKKNTKLFRDSLDKLEPFLITNSESELIVR